MKQEEAKTLIRNEYIVWKKNKDKINDNSKFEFFNYLQTHKEYLLNFKCSGDKWQTVNSMLSGL